MDWNRMRDQIGWALTGVESYEHREARLSEDTPERILQDLIAESRAWLAGDHPEPLVWMLNRAEQRLREVSGE
jgi:hypothetical protein